MSDFTWVGVPEFDRALHGVESSLDSATRRAVGDGARVLEALAKSRAPVLSGALRNSIHMDGPHQADRNTWRAVVGPTVPYGRRIEFGFHGTDRLGRHYDQSAHPYLRPAERAVSQPLHSLFMNRWGAAVRGR